MTLQLAVRITGDASSLKQAGGEAAAALAPITGAANQAMAATNALAAAQARGATATAAAAAAQGQAVSAVQAAAGVMSTAANAPGLRSDQWKNLSFQVNDVLTSLASGAPIMQVLAQQSGQVVGVLQDAPGGVAGALRIIGTRALGLVTPFAAAATAALSIGAAAGYAGIRWASLQSQIERGLLGIGRMSGATAGDIERIAAGASNGLLSRGDARQAAIAAAGTGKIGVGNIAGLVGLVPGFAQLTGSNNEDAAAQLAQIFSDPTKGAEEMASRIGALNDRTMQYIRTLDAQGDRQGAIAELIRASQPELERAAELTSAWAKAWNTVKGAAGSAMDTVGRAVAGPSVEEQLARVQRQIEEARKRGGLSERDRRMLGRTMRPDELDALDRQKGDEATRDLVAEQDRLQAEIDKRAKAAAEAQSDETSRKAGSAIRSALPDIAQLQDYQNRIELIRKALADPVAVNGLGPLAKRAQEAIDAAKGALESYIPAQEKARQSEALTIRSIEARTVAEKAAIAAEQKRHELASQAIEQDDRRHRIEAARTAVLAQARRDSEDRLRSANDNAATAGLPSYQKQVADLEAKYREIFRNSPETRSTDQAARDAERRGFDAVAIGGPLRDSKRALDEQVAGLRIQQQAFGASTETAARLAAAQELINRYTAAGVPITAGLRREIDEHAAAVGKAAAADEEWARKQRQSVGAADDLRSGIRGGTTGVFSDLLSGRNPLESLKSAGVGIASKMFDRMVSGPFVENLLGQDGKPGGGLLGGLFGGLLGGGSAMPSTIAAPMATVNATTVVVTGSLGAGAGGDLLKSLGLGGSTGSGLSAFGASGGTGTSSGGVGSSGVSAFGLSGPAIGGSLPVGSAATNADVTSYIRQAAAIRGIDPNIALKVAGSEGLKIFDPSRGMNAPGDYLNGTPRSFGPWQLFTGGGLGNTALAKGINVRDPSTWREQTDFALDQAKSGGWGPWYGARNSGIGNWEGINRQTEQATKSLSSLSDQAGSTSQGLGSLGTGFETFGSKLSQVSLDGSGGGLGGLGALGKLFGGEGGGVFTDAAVWVAGGGHVRGPGTGTSDDIPAWLSDGEFVVKASATSRHLPLLHAINDNRMPAFAEGGLVTPLPTARGFQGAGGGGSSGGDAGPPVITFLNQSGTPLQAGEMRRNPNGSYTQVLRSAEGGLADRAKNGQGPFAGAVGGAAYRRG